MQKFYDLPAMKVCNADLIIWLQYTKHVTAFGPPFHQSFQKILWCAVWCVVYFDQFLVAACTRFLVAACTRKLVKKLILGVIRWAEWRTHFPFLTLVTSLAWPTKNHLLWNKQTKWLLIYFTCKNFFLIFLEHFLTQSLSQIKTCLFISHPTACSHLLCQWNQVYGGHSI